MSRLPMYMIYDKLEGEYLTGYSHFKEIEEKVLEKIIKKLKEKGEPTEDRFVIEDVNE